MYVNGLRIIGKSALNETESYSVNPFDEYEIHMFEKDIQTKPDVSNMTVDFPIVHSPITNGRAIYLAREYQDILLKCCKFADEVRKQKGYSSIYLIVHCNSSDDNLANDKYMKDMYSLVNTLSFKCKHVYFCVENEVPVIACDNKLITLDSYTDQSVKLVKAIREKSKVPIFTVLDTCHLLMTLELIKRMNLNSKTGNLMIEDFFKWNKDTCAIVHLSTLNNTGIETEDHGIGFKTSSSYDMTILDELVSNIKTYLPHALVTLEQKEKSYKGVHSNKLETIKGIRTSCSFN